MLLSLLRCDSEMSMGQNETTRKWTAFFLFVLCFHFKGPYFWGALVVTHQMEGLTRRTHRP